jgi:hypothetical protein
VGGGGAGGGGGGGVGGGGCGVSPLVIPDAAQRRSGTGRARCQAAAVAALGRPLFAQMLMTAPDPLRTFDA